jgi:hypothetical protein
MKRHDKNPETGMYHVKGRKYELLVGSRAQVWHETAYKTSGGLTRDDLLQNKHGRIVSMKKHKTAKREKRLEKAGYKPKKGVFGVSKKSSLLDKLRRTMKRSRKNKKSRKSRR